MATKVKPSRLQITGTPQAWQVPVYVDQDTFSWWTGGGNWDVTWPASSTDWDVVLFDWATGKLIKDSWVQLSSKLDATALSNNAYGGGRDWDTTHTPTKDALYDKIHTMDVEIWNKAADTSVVKLTWNQTIAWTKTFSTSPVVPSKSTAATNTWTAIATEAQVKLVADDVATINWKIPSAATSSNQLADKNYVDDSINSVTAYYITKDAQGNQWSTRAELFAATTFYSWWVVRVPTKNDYTIVLADEQHDNATTRYIYNNSWEYQYTVNETALTQAQLNALNSWITSGKVSTYDWYASDIADKQDELVSGVNIRTINWTSILWSWDITTPVWWDVYWPASSTDWHIVLFDWVTWKSIKDWSKSVSDFVQTSWNQTIAWTKTFSTSPVVPSKTADATNTGTAIATEAQVYKKQDTISDLSTIRSGASAWATALQPSAISDTAYWSGWDADTTHAPSKNAVYDKISAMDTTIAWKQATLVSGTNIKTVNWNSLLGSWDLTIAWWVSSVNGNTWAVTVNEVPSWWSDGQVLTQTSGGTPTWQTPASWGITNNTTGTTTTVTGIWAWTETEYTNLGTKSGTVLYFTF